MADSRHMSQRQPEPRSISVTTLDRLVALLIVGIVLVGGYSWWQATRRTAEMDGMMGPMMGPMSVMGPAMYLFGTLVTASVVLGIYAVARHQLVGDASRSTPTAGSVDTGTPSQRRSSRPTVPEPDANPDGSAEGSSEGPPTPSRQLALLPEDERRVVEPILDSPGLTQVELRGRSDFSKAKVSQTVSKLEDRGLVYRERQGRTYRVYPGELLTDSQG